MTSPRSMQDLSADKQARVKTLIAEIEHYAADCHQQQSIGGMKAFKKALGDASARVDEGNPFLQLMSELPADRMKMLIDSAVTEAEESADEQDDKLLADLQKRSPAEQRAIFAYVSAEKNRYLNTRRLDKGQSALIARYDELIELAPFLINTPDDDAKAAKLASESELMPDFKIGSANFDRNKINSEYLAGWNGGDKAKRLGILKAILTRTHGEESMKGLHVMSSAAKGIGGAYISECDTLVVAEKLLELPIPAIALSIVAHEFQHRRQRQLSNIVGSLTKTIPDSEEALRARLFTANFKGGYIQPLGKGIWGTLAAVGPYMRQPVEDNANRAGDVFAEAMNSEPAKRVLKFNKVLLNAGGSVVRPMDRLFKSLGKGFGLLDRKDDKPPAPPAM